MTADDGPPPSAALLGIASQLDHIATYQDRPGAMADIERLADSLRALIPAFSAAALPHTGEAETGNYDVYVRLADTPVARTRTVADGVNVDFDDADEIVGVEVLGSCVRGVTVDGVWCEPVAAVPAGTGGAAAGRPECTALCSDIEQDRDRLLGQVARLQAALAPPVDDEYLSEVERTATWIAAERDEARAERDAARVEGDVYRRLSRAVIVDLKREQSRVAAVRKLHSPVVNGSASWCVQCDQAPPCSTIDALDGA